MRHAHAWIRCTFLAVLAFAAGTASAGVAQRVQRAKVAGIDLIVCPTNVKDIITIFGSFPAGDAFAAKGNPAVATLTSMMLDRGTKKHDKFAIAEKLESAGASVNFTVGPQTLGFGAGTLRKDLPLLVELIAEQLREPAFDPQEFEKVRQEFIGRLRLSLDDVDARADDAFVQAIFPDGHPNRQPATDVVIAGAERAKLDEVSAFHREYYGPKYFTLVMVGDVDLQQARKEVGTAFAGWRGGVDFIRAPAGAPVAYEAVLNLPEKASVALRLGQSTGVRYADPGGLALHVGTRILGSGFTGRLMSTVRDTEGLTYGIGAGISKDGITDGRWYIFAYFAPELLDRGVSSVRRELHKWWAQGVTDRELAAKKEAMIGEYQVSLSTTFGIGNAILQTVQRGYDISWLDEYPRALEGLTLEDVNGAIRKFLDPQKMVLVKAGTIEPAVQGE